MRADILLRYSLDITLVSGFISSVRHAICAQVMNRAAVGCVLRTNNGA
jgi:hypothetical protein